MREKKKLKKRWEKEKLKKEREKEKMKKGKNEERQKMVIRRKQKWSNRDGEEIKGKEEKK